MAASKQTLSLVRDERRQSEAADRDEVFTRVFSGGTSGGMTDDWKASVERQLEQLHGDVRALLYGLVGGGIVLLGAGWVAYDKLYDQMTRTHAEIAAVQVSTQRVEGKIDTLEARLGGKLDVLMERKDVRQTR